MTMGPDSRKIAIAKTGSIAERLAALQRSGEDDWKKRISKRDEVDDISGKHLTNNVKALPALNHTTGIPPISRGGSKVTERLGKLKTSSESWKQRVEPNDASKFTIGERLQKERQQPPEELQIKRAINGSAKKCPIVVVRSANQPQLGLAKSSSMRANAEVANVGIRFDNPQSLRRSLSVDAAKSPSAKRAGPGTVNGEASQREATETNSINAKTSVISKSVTVPRFDDVDTFENFFNTNHSSENINGDIELSAFDDITSSERLATRRMVQGPKRRRATPNVLKNLVNRASISNQYTEIRTDISSLVDQNTNISSPAKRNGLAPQALAGLASVEDFTSVALKSSSLPINQLWLPYKPRMLLHVKGRVHMQTRLVQAEHTALNRGDCFILVSKDQLFRYVGMFANIIEISRSKKICAAIIENRDLGCTAKREITLNDGKIINEHHWRSFCELLGKPTLSVHDIPDSGPVDEDEVFEASLHETNRFYEFDDDALVPMEKYWGCAPKVNMLESQKVLVFDFGSEVYVWNGKNAPSANKRATMKLAQEYFSAKIAVDYSQCYLNPLNYASAAGRRCKDAPNVQSDRRSDWCLLARITQNMETVLFKEKFIDWPEVECEDIEKNYLTNNVRSVKALDGASLYKGTPYEEPNLVLENSSLGRGNYYYDNNTMRHFDVLTKSVSKWQIHEFNFEESIIESYNHFYSAESYIIRWIYQISVTVRELSGNISKRNTVGRDRSVYFCWQGNDATSNEKGAAALLTVELDKEKGAQTRLMQGDEYPAFVRLFKPLFQHLGSRKDCFQRRATWRLYHIQGNLLEESMLIEVRCVVQQLRSRASMLLIHGGLGRIIVWHGCRSLNHIRAVATETASLLKAAAPTDLFTCRDGVHTTEVVEGNHDTLKNVFSDLDLNMDYGGLLLAHAKNFEYTPRLFNLSSCQGIFEATEIQHQLRCKDLNSPYPFKQTQLYNARQPTIFMLDDSDKIWLWMGWWPLEDVMLEVNSNDTSAAQRTSDNRAGVNRWISEMRAALETAISYWHAKKGEEEINGNVVWAGLEPIEFKVLFPYWEEHHDIKAINMQDGRTETQIPIRDMLAQITQTEYPLSVLKTRPLPEGVEPTRLELYLNDDDFEEALGMSRRDFDQLPLWKQTNLKKERGLF